MQEFREKAAELVAQLTLDEKVSLIPMDSIAVERLNIPEYDWWNEALHGVGRNGIATQFPQSICMASTWNPELIEEMATAIGDEARAKHHANPNPVKRYQGLTIWSPTINLARDPRWGRNEETYGEDPMLTSRMAIAFVRGLQGNHPKYLKTVATIKHFICNNTEYNRHSTRPFIPETYLRNYYMIPYRAAVKEANVQSVMTAYNGINDIPCGVHKWLLTNVLREEWGFSGTIVTDVNVPSLLKNKHEYVETHAEGCAAMLKAGVDVVCEFTHWGPHIKEAVTEGLLTEADLDKALIQNLSTRMMVGQILDAEDDPYRSIPESVVGSDKHCAIARKIAQQGIVLLKNDSDLLPISPRIKNIIVTGPYANDAQLGGYSGTPTHKAVTPYDGIKAAVDSSVTVTLKSWSDGLVNIPSANLRPADSDGDVHGLKGEYFADITLKEEPKTTRIDKDVAFIWPKPIENVDPLIPQPQFAVRWTGSLTPDVSGEYVIAGHCNGGVRIWLDGEMIADGWRGGGMRTQRSERLKLEAEKAYDIRMEYRDMKGDAEAHLMWQTPSDDQAANELDNSSTLVVYVCGFDMKMADEGRDLMDLDLPKDQLSHLQKMRETYSNIAVVFNGGTIVTDNWVYDNIPTILHAWYPGQEGGHALADLLLGKVSPSGRLPLTSYTSTDDIPDIDDYDLSKGRTYMYCKKKVRFPFGHGLSYTTFEYSELNLSKTECKAEDVIDIRVKLANTGAMDGEEVVQVYVKRKGFDDAPTQELKAFGRASVPKGETTTVMIELPVQRLERWNPDTETYEVPKGDYEIRVGSSSADIRQIATLTVNMI